MLAGEIQSKLADVKHGLLSLFLVAALAAAPVCAAGSAQCGGARVAPCCCGDEASCPCAHSQGQSPAPQPATAPAPSGPESLAVAAVLNAAILVGPLFVAGEVRQELQGASAEGPDAFLANCAYRC